MVDLTDAELHDALEEACGVAGIPLAGARLLHHYSNVVFALPAANAVARMTPGSRSLSQIKTSQTVTRWLVAEHDFGATEPLPDTAAIVVHSGVRQTRELTVSFWRYYPQPSMDDSGRRFDAADLGTLLKELHSISTSDGPPLVAATPTTEGLSRWRPLTTLRNVLSTEHGPAGLHNDESAWLRDQVQMVTDEIEAFDWPLEAGLIHGDAWAGNLLWDTEATPIRPILGDWDGVSYGPREIDLIPTWHAAVRYGRDHSWVERFVNAYGYDLAAAPGFDLLMRMRDLVQLSGPMRRASKSPAHHAALRQRFEAIRAGDRAMTWTGL